VGAREGELEGFKLREGVDDGKCEGVVEGLEEGA
jgi:hypothetical protein